MAEGALVDVEASINIRFGYDIRGEVVGEQGTGPVADTTSPHTCSLRSSR
jgi:myo-inositol 2-dehydrogenase / D-chiro-inositol 1-dehydrogenase